jgi:hypothetical protein
MKQLERLIGFLVTGTVALVVASYVLPRLVEPAIVLFGMAIIGRLVWFYTQRW